MTYESTLTAAPKADAHPNPHTRLDRLIQRMGLTLIAWSRKRADARAARRKDGRSAIGIFDADAGRLARAILPPPGNGFIR